MACALSCVRGGLNEFDTCLVELATPNWSWSYAKARFDVEQGSLSVTEYFSGRFAVGYRYCIYQMFCFRARRDLGCRSGLPTRVNAIHAGGSVAGKVSIRLSTISSSSVAVASTF